MKRVRSAFTHALKHPQSVDTRAGANRLTGFRAFTEVEETPGDTVKRLADRAEDDGWNELGHQKFTIDGTSLGGQGIHIEGTEENGKIVIVLFEET